MAWQSESGLRFLITSCSQVSAWVTVLFKSGSFHSRKQISGCQRWGWGKEADYKGAIKVNLKGNNETCVYLDMVVAVCLYVCVC